MERYKINGVSVAKYAAVGGSDKHPIILVHGGSHAGWCWDLWAKYLAQKGYEVHALDWYNHGESDDKPVDEFIHRSLVDVAHKEITFVADQLQKKPIVVGHSMGGLAAAVYASDSNKIKRLVLLAPVLPSAVGADPLPIPVDPSQPMPIFPYEQTKALFFTTMSDEAARRYYDKLESESPQAVLETTKWMVDVDLDKIKVPVMVLDGDQDQIIPLEPLGRYAKMLGTELKLIPGLGHCDILLKEPGYEQAVGAVNDWLDQKHPRDTED